MCRSCPHPQRTLSIISESNRDTVFSPPSKTLAFLSRRITQQTRVVHCLMLDQVAVPVHHGGFHLPLPWEETLQACPRAYPRPDFFGHRAFREQIWTVSRLRRQCGQKYWFDHSLHWSMSAVQIRHCRRSHMNNLHFKGSQIFQMVVGKVVVKLPSNCRVYADFA
jgi:hypothetical protein